MMRKIILTTIFTLLTLADYLAQDSKNHSPTVIPPAPSVNNLMKFEEIPISHYTGVPDVSIPIASMTTGINNINMSLSLKYHSLSLKPEDRAGEAGIGWSLFAGGTISRTVVDLPDEIETISVSGNDSKRKSGIYLDETLGNIVSSSKNYTRKFIDAIETSSNYLLLDDDNYRKLLYEALYQNKFDTSYDLYQYSFLNYSGRFIVIKNNGVLVPVSLDKNNLKIKCNHTSNTISSFEIIDEFGNKFLFNIKEISNTNYFSSSNNVLGGMGNISSGYSNPYTSSYHLSSIKNPSDIEFVSLNYFPEREIAITNLSEITRDYTIPLNFSSDQLPYANSSLPKISEYTASTVKTRTKQLESIEIKNKGKFAFLYDYGRLDNNYEGSLIGNLPRLKEIKMYDSNNHLIEYNVFFHNYTNGYEMSRLTLESVKKYDKQNGLISEYNLEYKPYFTYMDEDPWKYIKCNDAGYSYRDECAGAGQLKTITLPSRGKIDFDYEVNTYTHHPDSENFSPNTVEITNFDDNELNWDPQSNNINFTNFTSGYKFAFVIVDAVRTSFNFDFNALTQQNYQWNLTLYKKNGTNYTPVRSAGPGFASSGNVNYTIEPTVLENGEYYFRLDNYSLGRVPYFSVWVNSYYKVKNMNNYRFLQGGGIRVKNIKYYEADNNFLTTPAKMTEYLYGSPDHDKKSSGALVFPKPMNEYSDVYNYSFYYYEFAGHPSYTSGNNFIRTKSKDNFINVQKTKGGDIGYQYVTQKESGNGKTLFKFSSPIDSPNLTLPTFRPPFLPAENYDFRRGNILNKKIFKENDSNPLTEEKFEYTDTFTESIPLGIGLRFTGYPTFSEFVYGSVFKTYDEYKNAYDYSSIVVDGQTLSPHPYQPYCQNLTKDSYNFIAYYLKKEIIGKSNLIKHEIIDYFPNQKSSKTTKLYQYNARDYPTMITEISSEGDSNITTNQYAHEKGNTRLINANIIGNPLETESKKNNRTIGKTETLYDDSNHLFPTSIKSFSLKNIPSTEITYDLYDSTGNILQYTTKDGISTSIIWGYNSTQPIAKITGLSYSTAYGLAADIISASAADASDPANEGALIAALDNFRKIPALLNAQVTTYTYDPLIGVTSITPPSGIREIYIYDSANRLKEIKQQENVGGTLVYKTIKEFKYNYKH